MNKGEKIWKPAIKSVIEASLFMSSDYITLDELVKISESDNTTVINCIDQLNREYEYHKSALTIVSMDNSFKMTVRDHILPKVSKYADAPDITKAELKTLAVIACYSPVKQSDVIKFRGNKAYEHIKNLEKKGFISLKKSGKTYIISVTEYFRKYFRIDKETGDLMEKEALR